MDITHYTSILKEEESQIENEAKRTILKAKKITKVFMDKGQAELEFGFRLYQGGIVPENKLRVVSIEDTSVEACCSTHCDNTSEVGWIRLMKTTRTADGTVRLYYVAVERTILRLNAETEILDKFSELWRIPYSSILDVAERIFKGYKSLQKTSRGQREQILRLQTRYAVDNLQSNKSNEEDVVIYGSFLRFSALELKEKGKSMVFVGERFVLGFLAIRGRWTWTITNSMSQLEVTGLWLLF